MAQSNSLFYINDERVTQEKFNSSLDFDLANEQMKCTWNCTATIRRDLDEGYEVEVNGNYYRYGRESIYDSALEFIGDYIESGMHTDELFDALLKLPEENLKQLALSLDGVSELSNGNLCYED